MKKIYQYSEDEIENIRYYLHNMIEVSTEFEKLHGPTPNTSYIIEQSKKGLDALDGKVEL